MTILFVGGKQAGCVGLLTLLSLGHKIRLVVAYDSMMEKLAKELGITVYTQIKDADYDMFGLDLVVSVHGREKVPITLLNCARRGGINVHPCLSKYRGPSPVARLLKSKDQMASVGVHFMTDAIDEGPTIIEIPVQVTGKTEDEVYNELYPWYSIALIEAMRRIK